MIFVKLKKLTYETKYGSGRSFNGGAMHFLQFINASLCLTISKEECNAVFKNNINTTSELQNH